MAHLCFSTLRPNLYPKVEKSLLLNYLDGKTTDMTLETAKQQVLAQGESASKEALAIVRGGMTICEKKADGSRKYVWVKVKPTMTDDESSIDVALENQRMRKTRQPSTAPIRLAQTEPVIPNATKAPNLSSESETQIARPSFFERLKNKAVEIWHEIDSIVVE